MEHKLNFLSKSKYYKQDWLKKLSSNRDYPKNIGIQYLMKNSTNQESKQ